MHFSFNRDGSVHVISLNGSIQSGMQLRAILEKESGLISEGNINFVVNMLRLKFISGEGLRMLVECKNQARESDGDLILANVPQQIRIMLRTEGLADAFTRAESVEDAKAKFSQHT